MFQQGAFSNFVAFKQANTSVNHCYSRSVFADPAANVDFFPHQVRVHRWAFDYNTISDGKELVFQIA